MGKNQKELIAKYQNCYKGTNRAPFVKIKISWLHRVDGFYILMLSGAVLHGVKKDTYIIPKDALWILDAEHISYKIEQGEKENTDVP